MLNKVFAGFVVVFWAAMMAALVRVEIFPRPTVLDTCPTQPVLRKIFANSTPANLSIYQGKPTGEPIGHCRIEIRPKVNGEDAQVGQEPDTYEVTSDLKLRLPIWGISFWFLKGTSTFNRQLDLEVFDVTIRQTRRGGDSFNIKGDDSTKKVTVKFDFGDFQDERTFDYGEIQGVGLAGGLGIPGLPNLDVSKNNVESRVSNTGTHPHLVTTSYFDRLEIAGTWQRVYLIDSKFGDQYWTKIWVSETDGEVLKVSSSLGFEMLSDLVKAGAIQ